MGRSSVSIQIPVPRGVRRLRLDPGEAVGGLWLKTIALDDTAATAFTTNGFPLENGKYYFGAGDPQFIVSEIPEGEHTLKIEIEVMKEQEAREGFWKGFARASAEKDQEIQQLKRQIHEMENTKVWKLYKSIKK